MSEEQTPPRHPSKSAEAAAAKWGEKHPDEDPVHPPPPHVPEDDDGITDRHSAAAEAASLRWHEKHPDDD
jgi:hypothetical protein